MGLKNIGQQFLKPRSPDVLDMEHTYHTLPAPDELVKFVRQGKKYTGWPVSWDLTLQSMSSEFDANSILLMARSGGVAPNIWLSVNSATCPEIYYKGSGTIIRVRGNIQMIRDENIYLENCRLEFPKILPSKRSAW